MHILFQLLISLTVLGFCLYATILEYKIYKKNQEYLKHIDELVLSQASTLKSFKLGWFF